MRVDSYADSYSISVRYEEEAVITFIRRVRTQYPETQWRTQEVASTSQSHSANTLLQTPHSLHNTSDG